MSKERIVPERAIRRLIKYKGTCCGTCHDDNTDYDYDMCFIRGDNWHAEVCCAVKLAFENWKKERNHDDN